MQIDKSFRAQRLGFVLCQNDKNYLNRMNMVSDFKDSFLHLLITKTFRARIFSCQIRQHWANP